MLNVQLLAQRWPTQCRLAVLQSSNMLWLRPGMEARAASRGFSLDARELLRYTNHSDVVATHLRHPLFRALTDVPDPHYPMAYHEGSFYPIASVLAFCDFLSRALVALDAGHASPHADGAAGTPLAAVRQRAQLALERTLSRVPHWPEETWLQAYVANHDASYALVRRRGPLYGLAVGQLCWRGKAHFPNGTSRVVVDGIRNGTLRDASKWFACKVLRGLHDPVNRDVLGFGGG
jgi:hypothetical protein